MPIKSKAQRRKFAELLVTGKITPEAYERWNREAGSAELPERLHPKKDKPGRKQVARKTATGRKTTKTKSGKTTKTAKPKPKRKASAKKRA